MMMHPQINAPAPRLPRVRLTLTLVCLAVSHFACVSTTQDDFPNRLVGANGQLFTVEDLEMIANDAQLTEEEKRAQFRALGIEDEKLIEALLDL